MLYDEVRSAFVADVTRSLKSLEVKVEKDGGSWVVAVCPITGCKDKNGSAGIDKETGFLKCHQCGTAMELFTWVKETQSQPSTWDACKWLAELFHIPIPVKGKRPKGPLTDDALGEMEAALWGETNAYRTLLAERGFRQGELVPFRLGLAEGSGLLFAGWDCDGVLQERGHCWHGPRARVRWSWFPGKRAPSPLGLWPAWIPPAEDSAIWLFEGEWDVLVARTKYGLDAYTWTGGANSTFQEGKIPSWFKAKTVNVCYDLDVFAGPGVTVQAQGIRAQRNLFLKSAPMLKRAFGCTVIVRKVALDEIRFPKGDLRDWWGENKESDDTPADFPAWPIEEAWREPTETVHETSIHKLRVIDGKKISLMATAAGIEDEATLVHDVLHVDCQAGTAAACNSCRLLSDYPDGAVPVRDEGLFGALYSSGDLEQSMKAFLHPGRGCPGMSVREAFDHDPKNSKPAFRWHLCPPLDAEQQSSFSALSFDRPEQCKNYVVTGRLAAHPKAKATIIVDHLGEPLDQDFDVSPYTDELRRITPWHSNDAGEIWAFLNHRQEDLQANVTKIFQVDWAMGFDLMAHSALELPGNERGWVDAAFCGFTRSGKTATARQLIAHYGLAPGYCTSVQGNVSRSGLTTTTEKLQGSETRQWRARPGLFPRRDGRMVVLDEFHHMAPRGKTINAGRNELINELQSVRDRGFLDVEKAAHARFRARVRLLTISNPPRRNGFASYRYPCMVLRDLYGTDEAISRLDFLLVSTADESERIERHTSRQVWTQHLCTVIRQRAWLTKPANIDIAEEVVAHANDISDNWQLVYVSSLPLYTRREKWRSLLRVATSVAMLRFSHGEDPNQCVVKRADVEVARDFLEMTFESSSFNDYSLNELQRPQPDVLGIEACLLYPCGEDSKAKLALLFGPLHRSTIAERLGFTNQDKVGIEKWMSMLMTFGGMEEVHDATGAYSLTACGKATISAIMQTKWDGSRRDTLRRKYFDNELLLSIELRPLAGLEQWR